MKSSQFKVLLLVSLLCTLSLFRATSSFSQTHNFATFNIRYDNPGDEGNLWKDRLPHVISLIRFHQIGLFGTQEGLSHQISQMSEGLGYEYLGVGRDDGKEKGEYTAILFDPEIYTLEEHDTFWLSPTPATPSKGWDAQLNRICSWGKFRDKAGKRFYVFNIHYDHVGQKAREESSKLVIAQIEKINAEKLPVLLMGDFNVTSENAAYTTITSSPGWADTREATQTPAYGPEGSFTGFDWDKMPDGIIDHIFVHGPVEVIRQGVLTDNYGKKYPSDHFPVLVEVSF